MKIEHIAMYVNDLEGARKFFERYMGAVSNNLILSGPRTTGDGYYESCVVAIEGNQIEITV